jgi:hypothetical protein
LIQGPHKNDFDPSRKPPKEVQKTPTTKNVPNSENRGPNYEKYSTCNADQSLVLAPPTVLFMSLSLSAFCEKGYALSMLARMVEPILSQSQQNSVVFSAYNLQVLSFHAPTKYVFLPSRKTHEIFVNTKRIFSLKIL